MVKKTPEGKLKEEVKAYLDMVRAFYWMPVPSGYGKSAVDFIGCHKGIFFAIETKVKPNKVTKLQEAFMDDVSLAGGVTCVAYDIQAVIDMIATIEAHVYAR